MALGATGHRQSVTQGAPCTVCRHPRIAEIDADLSYGPTSGYTRTARIYQLKVDAVRRHKMNGHVTNQSLNKPVNIAVTPGSAPLSAVESLSATLHALNGIDTADMTPRELNLHTDLKRKVAVDLAKYQVAIDKEGPAQRELRALEEMVIAGDEALENYPEARAAVAHAISQWKARRSQEDEGS